MFFADKIADENKKIDESIDIRTWLSHEEVENILNQSFNEILKGSDEDEFIASFK